MMSNVFVAAAATTSFLDALGCEEDEPEADVGEKEEEQTLVDGEADALVAELDA